MEKFKKSILDFENYSLKGKMNRINGGGDGPPTEGDGKTKPPPPPPTGPFGPIIIKI